MNNSDKKVKKVVDAAKDQDTEIGYNPLARERLRSMGLDVPDVAKIVPWQDYVERLFSEDNKKAALERVRKLPPLPDIPVRAVVKLYQEILKCIAFGLSGAAITLLSVLAEFMLKYAAYKMEMGAFVIYDPIKADEFERLEFGDAVGRAARHRLLEKGRRKDLNDFRDKIRNPYLHYNLKKITAGW
jgi:hypothetical protein